MHVPYWSSVNKQRLPWMLLRVPVSPRYHTLLLIALAMKRCETRATRWFLRH